MTFERFSRKIQVDSTIGGEIEVEIKKILWVTSRKDDTERYVTGFKEKYGVEVILANTEFKATLALINHSPDAIVMRPNFIEGDIASLAITLPHDARETPISFAQYIQKCHPIPVVFYGWCLDAEINQKVRLEEFGCIATAQRDSSPSEIMVVLNSLIESSIKSQV